MMPRTEKRSLGGVAGLFFAAISSSCTSLDLEDVAEIGCIGSSDCPGGGVCIASRCMSPSSIGPSTLHVELSPPTGSRYVTSQFLDFSLDGPRLDLLLPAPTEYEVIVFDAEGTPVNAHFLAKGADRIPGREIDLSADLRGESRRERTVRLLRGEYGVRIEPLDTKKPGLETTFTVRPPEGNAIRREFRFRPYRKLFGEVVSSVSRDAKVAGVKVAAFSTRTGLPSTSTTTDARGHYALELPDTEDTAFRLVASPPDGEQPAWGFEEVIFVPQCGLTDPRCTSSNREKQIPLEPTASSVRGTARIRIGGQLEGFVPAVGANVTLTATTSEGLKTRKFEVKATTDNEGYVVVRDTSGRRDLQILKARYLLSVDPSSQSRFGRLSTMIDLTKTSPSVAPDEQILLPLRTPVEGSISSALGRPVPYARLELQPLDGPLPSVDITSDAEGKFEAWLEPGRYLMTVIPTSATDEDEIPPISVREIEVRSHVDREFLPALTLPASAALQGTVHGILDLEPIPNTKIEFFVEARGLIVSLGNTITDASGEFSIVLPELGGN